MGQNASGRLPDMSMNEGCLSYRCVISVHVKINNFKAQRGKIIENASKYNI